MSLEDDLKRLSATRAEIPLDGVEAAVWRSTARHARMRDARYRRAQLAAAALAAAVFAGAAGVQAAARTRSAPPSEFAVLAASTDEFGAFPLRAGQ